MRPVFIAFGLIAILAAPASAAIVVQVGNSGRGCYEATLMAPSPDTDSIALQTCNQAVADAGTDHEHVAAYVNRSDVRLRMQDYNGALADAEKALALEPSQATAHLNRGAAMVGMKRDADAVAVLTQASTLSGIELELVYYNRAIAEERMGDIKAAYLDYHRALDANPKFQLAADQLTRFQVTR